ncbi:hypothetical protein KVT40_003478 [Elsinoe batatas]|uniref:N-acetyltransferase domain-containing protein n=1 Tax=Elsinoe batatas TaxID=2601811 RepID=A0A8K0L7M8_9PEZI|nr:hypothetical protein KVT40_003478 [Elsinoe batatas]
MSASVDVILQAEKVPDPTIVTPRLRLRPPRPDDLNFMHWLHLSQEATRWTPSIRSKSLEDTEKRLAMMLSEHSPLVHMLVVELLPTDDRPDTFPIGTAGSFRPSELGYGFHQDYFGKGYGTEAALAYCHWFRAQYPGERMIGKTFPENLASVRVLEKCGFTAAREGEREDWPLDEGGGGTWIDRTGDVK